MRRKQVYIDDDLDEALARLAALTREPEAAHVRRALRAYLEQAEAREAAAPYRADTDPLLAFIGAAGEDAGPVDSAEEHDHYLYGAPRRRPSRKPAAGRARGRGR